MTSLFTKRHHQLLATFVADARLSVAQTRTLAAMLEADNPRFSHLKFRAWIDSIGIDNTHTKPQTTNPTRWRGTLTTHNPK